MDGLLYLADGSIYKGKGFGTRGTAVGELVFNTSMTGYQEILTDPSYWGQIITMTYPLIGNYGINKDEWESKNIYAKGFVTKTISKTPSNYKSEMSINEWLEKMNVVGVYDLDTRNITKKIREKGTVKCVITNEDISLTELQNICMNNELKEDWMKEAGTKEIIHIEGNGHKIAVLDFGAKASIINSLKERKCDITIFPYKSTYEDIISISPEGLLLSNGPGNPKEAVEAIEVIKQFIGKIPIFGICMGHQVLALALGGDTYKLKYGHRGGNHGVYDKDIDKAYITSQNHGYAVKAESIFLKGMEITHINLNDETVEGMKHKSLPIFSVQFHPEASPGPRDSKHLFDKFLSLIKED